MDDIELLFIEDILEIHKEAIEKFGGSFEFYRDTELKIKSILDHNILISAMINILLLLKKQPCSGISLRKIIVL